MPLPPESFVADIVSRSTKLKSFAVSLCRDTARADDLVQETILRALINHARFEEGTNLEAWLFTILRNLFFTGRRKVRNEVEDPHDTISRSIGIDDSPLRKMEAREVLALIEKMPDRFRQPLRLLADGASYEEAAAELHEHIGTIKSRVSRVREMLKVAT